MKELQKEFENMERQPVFEIDYEVYCIEANEIGLYAGGCTNTGVIPYDGLFVAWDDNMSLDKHLEAIYDLCLEVSI